MIEGRSPRLARALVIVFWSGIFYLALYGWCPVLALSGFFCALAGGTTAFQQDFRFQTHRVPVGHVRRPGRIAFSLQGNGNCHFIPRDKTFVSSALDLHFIALAPGHAIPVTCNLWPYRCGNEEDHRCPYPVRPDGEPDPVLHAILLTSPTAQPQPEPQGERPNGVNAQL